MVFFSKISKKYKKVMKIKKKPINLNFLISMNNSNKKVFPDLLLKTDTSHVDGDNLDSHREKKESTVSQNIERKKTSTADYLLSFLL